MFVCARIQNSTLEGNAEVLVQQLRSEVQELAVVANHRLPQVRRSVFWLLRLLYSLPREALNESRISNMYVCACVRTYRTLLRRRSAARG